MVDFSFKTCLIMCVVVGTSAVLLPNPDNEIASRILLLEKHSQSQQIQTKRLEEIVEVQQKEIKNLNNHNELLQIKVTRLEESNADQQTHVQHLLKHEKLLQNQIRRFGIRNKFQQNESKHVQEHYKLGLNQKKRHNENDELIHNVIKNMNKIDGILPNNAVLMKEEHDNTNLINIKRLQQPITYIQQQSSTPLTTKPVNRIRRAENVVEIAFFATLTHDQLHIGEGQSIKFDNVITNIGNGYHGHIGTFIAPVDGTYVFSVTLLSGWYQQVVYEIVKNGAVVSRISNKASVSGDAYGSQTFILQLIKDDDVVIRNQIMGMGTVGSHYSTFAGFLI